MSQLTNALVVHGEFTTKKFSSYLEFLLFVYCCLYEEHDPGTNVLPQGGPMSRIYRLDDDCGDSKNVLVYG